MQAIDRESVIISLQRGPFYCGSFERVHRARYAKEGETRDVPTSLYMAKRIETAMSNGREPLLLDRRPRPCHHFVVLFAGS